MRIYNFNLFSIGDRTGYGGVRGVVLFGVATRRYIQKALFGYWIMNDKDQPKEHIMEIFFIRFIFH